MELVERYLAEVGRQLPRKDRDDILAELRSLVMDSLEDRIPEGEPSEDDIIAVLREHGSPREVATAYGKDRYLVGPALYPFLMTNLRIGLIVIGILFLVRIGITLSIPPFPDNPFIYLAEALANTIQTLLAFAGSVMIIFAVLEYFDVRPENRRSGEWEPRNLPAVDSPVPVDRVGMLVGIAFSLLWLFLLNFFRQYGGITFLIRPGAGEPNIVIPITSNLLIALSAVVFAQVLTDLYVLQQRRWQISTRLLRGVLDLTGAFLMYRFVLQTADGVLAIAPDLGVKVIIAPDRVILLWFVVVIAVIAIKLVLNLIKLSGVKPLTITPGPPTGSIPAAER